MERAANASDLEQKTSERQYPFTVAEGSSVSDISSMRSPATPLKQSRRDLVNGNTHLACNSLVRIVGKLSPLSEEIHCSNGVLFSIQHAALYLLEETSQEQKRQALLSRVLLPVRARVKWSSLLAAGADANQSDSHGITPL